MIYSPFDIVEVPFPFSDRDKAKKRKALVLSAREYNETNAASVLMMITSAEAGSWLGDVKLKDWQGAGLKKPCIARVKLFTLDNALIIEKVGKASVHDQTQIQAALNLALPFRKLTGSSSKNAPY